MRKRLSFISTRCEFVPPTIKLPFGRICFLFGNHKTAIGQAAFLNIAVYQQDTGNRAILGTSDPLFLLKPHSA